MSFINKNKRVLTFQDMQPFIRGMPHSIMPQIIFLNGAGDRRNKIVCESVKSRRVKDVQANFGIS